jgi:hypothetical protein
MQPINSDKMAWSRYPPPSGFGSERASVTGRGVVKQLQTVRGCPYSGSGIRAKAKAVL